MNAIIAKTGTARKTLKNLVGGGKYLIINTLGMGLLTVTLSAQPQGAFYSPSTSVLQSPNVNSAIGIVPQSDWRFTLNLRASGSNPTSKGIDIWTNTDAITVGQPIVPPPDVFRVTIFSPNGSSYNFPVEVFKIDGFGNITGKNYLMGFSNTLRFSNNTFLFTELNSNGLVWRRINDTQSGQIFLASNNRIGVNTNAPEAPMHIKTMNTPNYVNQATYGLIIENDAYRHEDYAFRVKTNQGDVLRLANNGALFLGEGLNGNNLEGYRLYVQNGIRAERIKVDISVDNGWADFVFDEDYVLMPIDELEAFIKKNKHLPNVPSEAQVKAEGIDLAEMNAILLRQIEELTLRVIELEKAK